jgi:3-dehydroquinate dehydratase
MIESVKLSDPNDSRPVEATRPDKTSQTFQEYLEKEKQKIKFAPSWALLGKLYLENFDNLNSGNIVSSISGKTGESSLDQSAGQNAPISLSNLRGNESDAQTSQSQTAQSQAQVGKDEIKQFLAQYFPNLPLMQGLGTLGRVDSLGAAQKKIDLSQLIDEIVDQVKAVKENSKSELSLALKSDNLGSILLTISRNEGKISIQIVANAETKQYLDDHLSALQDALKNAHLAVGNLNVSVGNRRDERQTFDEDKDFDESYSLFGENMVQQSQINWLPVPLANSILPVDNNSTLYLEV